MSSKGLVFESSRITGSVPPPAALRDRSRYHNDGVFGAAAAAPSWVLSPGGVWVNGYDGGDYITVAHSPSLNFISTCSFSFWANFASFPAPGGLRYVLDKGNLGASTGYMILLDGVNPYVSLLIVMAWRHRRHIHRF